MESKMTTFEAPQFWRILKEGVGNRRAMESTMTTFEVPQFRHLSNRRERRAMWSKRKGAGWRIIKEGVGIELHATKGFRRGTRYGKPVNAVMPIVGG